MNVINVCDHFTKNEYWGKLDEIYHIFKHNLHIALASLPLVPAVYQHWYRNSKSTLYGYILKVKNVDISIGHNSNSKQSLSNTNTLQD